jgi:hypothetical protein
MPEKAIITERHRTIGVVVFLIVAGIVFYCFNPYNYSFPRCPVNYTTGLKCMGCGSQRAIHFILHGQLVAACRENLLVVLSIPYLLFSIFVYSRVQKNQFLLLRKTLYGRKAIIIILAIIIMFTIVRNSF